MHDLPSLVNVWHVLFGSQDCEVSTGGNDEKGIGGGRKKDPVLFNIPVAPISLMREQIQGSICQITPAPSLEARTAKTKESVFHTTLHYLSSKFVTFSLSVRTEQHLHILRNIFSCLTTNVIFQLTERNNTWLFALGGTHPSDYHAWSEVCSEHNYTRSRVLCLVINKKVQLPALCLLLPSDRFQGPMRSVQQGTMALRHARPSSSWGGQVLLYVQQSTVFPDFTHLNRGEVLHIAKIT